MLERHVEVGQHIALGHQGNDLVHMRIGVDVMQPHPHVEFAQRARQLGHARLQRAPAPETGAVFDVDAVGRGVLRNHQQLLHPGLDQVLRLLQHLAHRAAHQIAAHAGDNAERTAMVAALGNLEVGVVLRREANALRRHEIGIGVVRLGAVRMHRLHHLFERMRSGHGQHVGMRLAHHVALCAEAAGHDHLAVLGQRLADRIERLLDGGIDEAARIDHDQIGVLIAAGNTIAFRAQLSEDAFGVGRSLGTAEGDKSDLGSMLGHEA